MLMMFDPGWMLKLKILKEGPAERCIDELDAAADTQNRFICF